mmetsp:Transcript_67605/g.155093  ORF Transcript_67605/g.155093 Transcript_67605/m.155093 type:complete len:314 (+) Transcript_67605:696-1637(+)
MSPMGSFWFLGRPWLAWISCISWRWTANPSWMGGDMEMSFFMVTQKPSEVTVENRMGEQLKSFFYTDDNIWRVGVEEPPPRIVRNVPSIIVGDYEIWERMRRRCCTVASRRSIIGLPHGLRLLRKEFYSMREPNCAAYELDMDRFACGFRAFFSFDISPAEDELLLKWFGRKGNKDFINVDLLVDALRGNVHPGRWAYLDRLYDILQRDVGVGEGARRTLTFARLANRFKCPWHPEVGSGEMTNLEAQEIMFSTFSLVRSGDEVSREDFMSFHEDLTCNLIVHRHVCEWVQQTYEVLVPESVDEERSWRLLES